MAKGDHTNRLTPGAKLGNQTIIRVKHGRRFLLECPNEHRRWISYSQTYNVRDGASCRVCAKREERFITYNGRTQRLHEWAKERGIERKTLHCRFKEKWTVAQALGFKPRPRPNLSNRKCKHYMTIDGETKPLNAWARAAEVDPSIVFHRYVKLGWTPEEALYGRKKSAPDIPCAYHPANRASEKTTVDEVIVFICNGCCKRARAKGFVCTKLRPTPWNPEYHKKWRAKNRDRNNARRRQKRRADQEWAERERTRNRAYFKRRRLVDPAFAERQRAQKRASWHRKSEQERRKFLAGLSKEDRQLLIATLDNINGEVNDVSNE